MGGCSVWPPRAQFRACTVPGLRYRKVDLAPDELILRVDVPDCKPCEFVMALKQARRREDDISINMQSLCNQYAINMQSICTGAPGPTAGG